MARTKFVPPGKKLLRLDEKTWLEVDAELSEEEGIERVYLYRQRYEPDKYHFNKKERNSLMTLNGVLK